jgi:putative glycosyltransferase
LISAIAVIILIIRRVFFNVLLSGWPSLIVSIWFLGGLTIFSLGVIGIYIAKIFSETKQRPYTIIRRIYESKIGVNL